ncbi:MAG: PEGA domain-containing protein [Vicinamibacterales bacterium]
MKHDMAVGEVYDLVVPLQFGSDPGFLDISTDPPGAAVYLDGEARGRSPLALADLSPGEHELRVELGAAQLQRRFTLAPAERLTLYVPLAGWLTVRSRVPVDVLDKGRAVGASDSGRLLVPAGRRRLQFVNNEFGVNTSQDVIIRAGQQADLTVPLTHGTLSVATDIPADVWVDGQSIGRTPTGNLDVPVGEHDVFVSHPDYGDQRLTVIVGMGAPTRLSVRLDPGLPRATSQRSPKRSGSSAAR